MYIQILVSKIPFGQSTHSPDETNDVPYNSKQH